MHSWREQAFNCHGALSPEGEGWTTAIEAVLEEYASAGTELSLVQSIEIKTSGDMGVCAGTYVFEVPGESGAPVEQHGKFVTAFLRQPDGAWRAVVDSLLSDAT